VRQAAEERRPKLIEVSNDDELTDHDDPAAALRTPWKDLQARAAQRDLTIDGLPRSRFTTPEILRNGRNAGEHIVTAARAVYNRAIADGHIDPLASLAHRVAKPRRNPSTR
jgi:hypothetical protein